MMALTAPCQHAWMIAITMVFATTELVTAITSGKVLTAQRTLNLAPTIAPAMAFAQRL